MPVYRNPNGTWKYRAYKTDVYGKRRQYEKSGFATKREAQMAEHTFLTSNDEKKIDISFSELWTSYECFIKNKMKQQSYRKTVSKFENHILPYFKDCKVKSLNVDLYTNWQNEILKKGFKYRYNSSIHGSVVTILNYAIKFYGLESNIASQVGNFNRKYDIEKNVDFWTLDEFNKFISVVDEKIYKIFYTTLYYTGLRQGECLALTWKDFKDDYLDIYKTISKEKVDGDYVINTPKTKKSIRKVKIDKNLKQVLNELKQDAMKYEGFNEDFYIFGGIKPLSTTTIGRKKDKYCATSGVKKIRIHDFRHSHASLLLSYGVPITVISQRLGHSDITMTLNTYSHLIPNDEDKAIDILNKINTLKIEN